MLKMADKVIVPLQPSIFDIYATQAFLDKLREHRHAAGVQVGIVGMRIDERTLLGRAAAPLCGRPGPARAGLCATRKTMCIWRPRALGV